MSRAAALAAALAATVLVGACGGGGDDSGARKLRVTLGPGGCPERLKARAGPTTFEIVNEGSDTLTEFEVLRGSRVLGERENLTEGLSSSLTLDLRPGRYGIRCAASGPQGTLFVEP
jgi:iron uptake system EfeUOB component EfeO/EfeM